MISSGLLLLGAALCTSSLMAFSAFMIAVVWEAERSAPAASLGELVWRYRRRDRLRFEHPNLLKGLTYLGYGIFLLALATALLWALNTIVELT